MLLFLAIPYLVVAAQPCMEWILIKKTFDESSFIMTFLSIKAPFLILHFSYYTLMTFLMMLSVILLSILMIWSLATARIEFWTRIWSTWQCGLGKWKWLVDFNAGKTQLVSFDRSDNIGAINVKMDGFVLEEKLSFKMLSLTFSWFPWFVLWSVFLLRLLYISINLLYCLDWNLLSCLGWCS